ncbi:hypothetical protein [Streptomyces sp. NPDC047803]|uniref:hypothetical protein n=1 Tax=Streptomyces TaxID=1883 RepID=UPI0033CC2FCC
MSADPDDESSRSGLTPGDTGDMEHVSAPPVVPGRADEGKGRRAVVAARRLRRRHPTL